MAAEEEVSGHAAVLRLLKDSKGRFGEAAVDAMQLVTKVEAKGASVGEDELAAVREAVARAVAEHVEMTNEVAAEREAAKTREAEVLRELATVHRETYERLEVLQREKEQAVEELEGLRKELIERENENFNLTQQVQQLLENIVKAQEAKDAMQVAKECAERDAEELQAEQQDRINDLEMQVMALSEGCDG